MDIQFKTIYDDAVAGFIQHASDFFDAEAARLVITHAEAQYFSLRVNATEEARRSRTTHTVPIVRENLANVTVLLLKPTVDMVVRALEEGMRQEMVCSFEIEGVYTLPDTDRGKYINTLSKGLPYSDTESYWKAMFNEVFRVATGILNEQLPQQVIQ